MTGDTCESRPCNEIPRRHVASVKRGIASKEISCNTLARSISSVAIFPAIPLLRTPRERALSTKAVIQPAALKSEYAICMRRRWQRSTRNAAARTQHWSDGQSRTPRIRVNWSLGLRVANSVALRFLAAIRQRVVTRNHSLINWRRIRLRSVELKRKEKREIQISESDLFRKRDGYSNLL